MKNIIDSRDFVKHLENSPQVSGQTVRSSDSRRGKEEPLYDRHIHAELRSFIDSKESLFVIILVIVAIAALRGAMIRDELPFPVLFHVHIRPVAR